LKQIQADNLLQVIGNDLTVLHTAELQAIEETYGYLAQKYDTTMEFTDTLPWSFTSQYQAGDRIYLDATAYNATSGTYALNALTLQGGKVYICTTAITAPEAFNAAKWTLLGNQYQLFYGSYPKPIFDYLKLYSKGDQVYWKGKVYTAQRDSFVWGDDIQFRQIQNIPAPNVFPDDPTNGQIYWGTGTAYTIAAGTLPTDSSKWTNGDNRTQSILMCVIDVCLYHIHSRIAPRNVPDLRRDRYINAVDMLRAYARGEMTAKLPLLQPKSGQRVRYGGNIKNINSY
jgi:hypothetical protein